MHAKPDLRVFFEWMINRSGSVITDVIRLSSMEMPAAYSVKHSFRLDGRGVVIVPAPEIDGATFRIGDRLAIVHPDGTQHQTCVKYIEILSSRTESTWVVVLNEVPNETIPSEGSKFWLVETGDSKYHGMTVNERLFAAGLLDEFDTAVTERDRTKMIELLSRTAMTPVQCSETTDAILAKPTP